MEAVSEGCSDYLSCSYKYITNPQLNAAKIGKNDIFGNIPLDYKFVAAPVIFLERRYNTIY